MMTCGDGENRTVRPKITVCIPTYNYGNFIGETIESVLMQDWTDYELLVVDDCSSDDTAAVVEGYARQDPRIRFIVNANNLGMVHNWNHCMELAQGEYIKFVFGDDLLSSPDALGRMAEILDGDNSIALVGSARNFIDEHSVVIGRKSFTKKSSIFSGRKAIHYCLVKQSNLIGEPSAVMFRKNQAMRGFNPHYKQIVDLEMWFHLLEHGSFAYIEEPLCSFRVHDRQQTVRNRESLDDLKDPFYLFGDYLDRDYITLSNFMKKYLLYDHVYSIWKRSRNDTVRKTAAIQLINEYYDFKRFNILLPLYKLYKPLFKLYMKLNKMV
jgi:glycosyltransferase involved in cell wall biosynthesis